MARLQLLEDKRQIPEFSLPLTTSQLLEIGSKLSNPSVQYTNVFGGMWSSSPPLKVLRVANRRQTELQWRRTHQDALRPYLGQWVVLEGEQIVASGPSLAEVVLQARGKGVRIPYVFRVDYSDQNTATIGL